MSRIDAIKAARKDGRLADAMQLIVAEANERNGQVSSLLSDQWALTMMQGRHFAPARDVYLLLANKFPDQPNVWRNIGECSEGLGEYEAAKTAYRKAVECFQATPGPDSARAWFGFGSQLFRLGESDLAVSWWRDGLAQDCSSPDAIFQRGHVKLTLGDPTGWQDLAQHTAVQGYAAAVRGHTGKSPEDLPPAWDGKAEGMLLVYGDQGAGDAILFSRYLPQLANPYYLVVGQPLRALLDGWTQPPTCDWSVPLTSLPRLLHTTEPVPPQAFHAWRRPRNRTPRVGVCWKGSPVYLNDWDRSCPFDPRPQLADPRWEIYSLQQGIDFHSPDYRWNADYLNNLDAVVTVDTSTAHLAGMMGVPTILLAQSQPFWCWGFEGESSPWYPSVTIVRRATVEAWPDALDRAKRHIETMLATVPPPTTPWTL